MVLRMKNFFGVYWKIRLWGEGGFMKNQYYREKERKRERETETARDRESGDYLKRGAWTVCQFKGGWYPNNAANLVKSALAS